MKKYSDLNFGLMTALLSTLTLSAALPTYSLAGANTGGGGDASESRVNEIRADILKWISEGGAQGLKLPSGMPLKSYEKSMSTVLAPQAVATGFVTTLQESQTNDPELKVSVNGQPKTCRGFISQKDSRPHILCNIERFSQLSESQQYQLIHHEYAGLAGVETNTGPDSDYSVSSQLIGYLTPQVVLKLAIKRNNNTYELVSQEGNGPCPSQIVMMQSGNQLLIQMQTPISGNNHTLNGLNIDARTKTTANATFLTEYMFTDGTQQDESFESIQLGGANGDRKYPSFRKRENASVTVLAKAKIRGFVHGASALAFETIEIKHAGSWADFLYTVVEKQNRTYQVNTLENGDIQYFASVDATYEDQGGWTSKAHQQVNCRLRPKAN